MLDTAAWRASPDWAEKLGYSPEELDDFNRKAVALARELGEGQPVPVVVNGVVGPRGDGYDPDDFMSAEEAEGYHSRQIGVIAEAGVDMISAITMTYADEAISIVRAGAEAGLSVVVSFTVETDGRLPNGQSLGEAIEDVDAATNGAAAYFMINCAHPRHFADVLEEGPWLDRIRGLRANASTKSHAELDEAEELDEGDPAQLAADHRALRPRLAGMSVLGGCCGTNHRHVGEVCAAWLD